MTAFMVRVWYVFYANFYGTHLVRVRYASATRLVRTTAFMVRVWYAFYGTRLVRMVRVWYASGTRLVRMTAFMVRVGYAVLRTVRVWHASGTCQVRMTAFMVLMWYAWYACGTRVISDPASAYVHVCEAHIAQIWIDICACM